MAGWDITDSNTLKAMFLLFPGSLVPDSCEGEREKEMRRERLFLLVEKPTQSFLMVTCFAFT